MFTVFDTFLNGQTVFRLYVSKRVQNTLKQCSKSGQPVVTRGSARGQPWVTRWSARVHRYIFIRPKKLLNIWNKDIAAASDHAALRVLVMQWKLEVIIPTVYSINNALTVIGIAINRKLVP